MRDEKTSRPTYICLGQENCHFRWFDESKCRTGRRARACEADQRPEIYRCVYGIGQQSYKLPKYPNMLYHILYVFQ